MRIKRNNGAKRPGDTWTVVSLPERVSIVRYHCFRKLKAVFETFFFFIVIRFKLYLEYSKDYFERKISGIYRDFSVSTALTEDQDVGSVAQRVSSSQQS